MTKAKSARVIRWHDVHFLQFFCSFIVLLLKNVKTEFSVATLQHVGALTFSCLLYHFEFLFSTTTTTSLELYAAV